MLWGMSAALNSHADSVTWIQRPASLTCASPAPHLRLTCASPAPHLRLTCTSPLPHLYFTFTSPAPYRYLTFTSPSPHLYLTFTLPLPYLHLTCTSLTPSCLRASEGSRLRERQEGSFPPGSEAELCLFSTPLGGGMASEERYRLYHGLPLPKLAHSEDSLEYLEAFQVQDDDIFGVTYPKSGTTWMQEIIPLLLNGGDLTPVESIPNWDRVPWLEETRLALVVDKLSPPRAMVSHMPHHLMPSSFHSSKAKVIYIARNPKDILVSSFYFHQMASFLDDPGTFEEFMDKFLAGQVLFGKWTDHVKSWRNTDLGDRILHITYEELVQDLRGVLERILQFLGRQMSEEALNRVTEHCLFKNMKHNKMSNYSLVPEEIMDNKKSPFLRKGIVGDWKNHFSPELEAKFNTAIRKEMEGSGVKFPWDEE